MRMLLVASLLLSTVTHSPALASGDDEAADICRRWTADRTEPENRGRNDLERYNNPFASADYCKRSWEHDKSNPVAAYRYGLTMTLFDRSPTSQSFGADLLRQSAQSGYGPAQRALGAHLVDGKIVELDMASGRAWLEKAYAAGQVEAAAPLGMSYASGKAQVDAERAWYWLDLGVAASDPDAMFRSGAMTFNGDLGRSDRQRGMELIVAAARAGHVTAQVAMGNMLSQGVGWSKDEDLAMEWYREAALNGDATARQLVAEHQRQAEQNQSDLMGAVIAGGALLLMLGLLSSGGDGGATSDDPSSSYSYQPPESPWKDACWLMDDMEQALAGC